MREIGPRRKLMTPICYYPLLILSMVGGVAVLPVLRTCFTVLSFGLHHLYSSTVLCSFVLVYANSSTQTGHNGCAAITWLFPLPTDGILFPSRFCKNCVPTTIASYRTGHNNSTVAQAIRAETKPFSRGLYTPQQNMIFSITVFSSYPTFERVLNFDRAFQIGQN